MSSPIQPDTPEVTGHATLEAGWCTSQDFDETDIVPDQGRFDFGFRTDKDIYHVLVGAIARSQQHDLWWIPEDRLQVDEVLVLCDNDIISAPCELEDSTIISLFQPDKGDLH